MEKINYKTVKNIFFIAVVLFASKNYSQQNVFNRDNANTGDWGSGNNPWFYQTTNNSQGDPDNGGTTRNDVFIGHNNFTTMSLNGRFYLHRDFTFQAGATTSRILNNTINGGFSFTRNLINQSSATHTFNTPVGIDATNASISSTNAAGGLTFNGTVFTNNHQVFFNSIGTIILNGPMPNGGAIVKQGNGVLQLSSNANFSGSIFIDQGVLRADRDLSSNQIQIGAGVQDQTGNTAILEINSGQFSKGITVRNFGLNSGDRIIRFTNSVGQPNLSSTITLEKTVELSSLTNARISGNISGTFGIIKTGVGSLEFTGLNSYTGTTTVNSGTLLLNREGGATLSSTNDVIVNTSATLRISKDQTLNSLILNGGTISIDNGIVLTVTNLESSGASTILGSGMVRVLNVLTINSGNLETNSNLVLVSTATNTARVAPITSGSITGQVTVERFIPSKRGWRFLTAPLRGISNNTIASNWQGTNGEGLLLFSPAIFQSQTMQGYATGGSSPNIYSYGTAWQSIPNLASEAMFGANPLDTKAYQVFATGSHGSSHIVSGSVATTLRPRGELVTGTVSHTLTANTFKLLANPYASPLNTQSLVQANSGSKVWLLDPTIGNFGGYVTYDGSEWSIPQSGNDVNIQSGQGFMVRSTGTTFTIQESHKATGTTNTWFERSANLNNDKLRILLYKQIDNEWKLADGILTVNSENGSNDVDGSDAVKISNFNESMMFRNGTNNLSIEYRATPNATTIQPIRLTGTTTTTYQFRAYTEGYLSEWIPMLEDTQQGTISAIPTDGSMLIVPFNGIVSSNNNPDNRFRIIYQSVLNTPNLNVLQVKVYPNPTKETFVNIVLEEESKAVFTLFTTLGQSVMQGELVSNQNQLDISQLHSGIYILKVRQENKSFETKLIID